MRFPARRAIQSRPVLKPHRDLPLAAKVHDLLHTCAAGAFRDQDTIDGTARLQRLTNGMNPDKNTHALDSTVIEKQRDRNPLFLPR